MDVIHFEFFSDITSLDVQGWCDACGHWTLLTFSPPWEPELRDLKRKKNKEKKKNPVQMSLPVMNTMLWLLWPMYGSLNSGECTAPTDRCKSQPAKAWRSKSVREGEIQQSERVTVREKGSDGKRGRVKKGKKLGQGSKKRYKQTATVWGSQPLRVSAQRARFQVWKWLSCCSKAEFCPSSLSLTDIYSFYATFMVKMFYMNSNLIKKFIFFSGSKIFG